jgi:hypothetical protein
MSVKSYSKFTYSDIEALGIKLAQTQIFSKIQLVEPSDHLVQTLTINLKRPMATEKAKSEFFITPVLNELAVRNSEQITFFSGYTFQVDSKLGLSGMVDFLISRTPLLPVIKAPIFCVVEAKNENLEPGVPQCIAEMYAAKLFNEQQGKPTPCIYGATSYGLAWRFIRLEGDLCTIDTDIYYINELPQLLGALQFIVDHV